MKTWKEIINSPDKSKFNHCSEIVLPPLKFGVFPEVKRYDIEGGLVVCVDNLILNAQEFLEAIDTLNYKPVASDGYAGKWNENQEKVSGRISTYDTIFAEKLSQEIKKVLPSDILSRSFSSSSVNVKKQSYEFAGINPYIRFIKYENQKKLNNHYDKHAYFNESIQTVMTCLIYLTASQTGQTVFLEDDKKTIKEKNLGANQDEKQTILAINPKPGRILFFDQYLLHNTSNLINEKKSLILTDMVMQYN